jgi:hypothetical protein
MVAQAAGERVMMCCPVSYGNFEHLSHVAVNLPSLFVRAGDASGFCSPNEQ